MKLEDNTWYLLCGILMGLILGLQVPTIDWLPWWPVCAKVLIAWALLSAGFRVWRRWKNGHSKG